MSSQPGNERSYPERKFVICLALAACFAALLPAIYAFLAGPPGNVYIGYQTNTDDHMVYAAWMRQAMDGHFLFDNRFTTDSQPGLTIHVYFLLLGWIAKGVGIPFATGLARIAFGYLFIVLAFRFIRKLKMDTYANKLALALVVLGGGTGFLVWHNYGDTFKRPYPDIFSTLMLGKLPTDVWQPEGFVFPSLLTNSLFMVSLCLITWVFLGVLRAQEGWKPVGLSALAFGILMNIHSYDVLLIAFVLIGFLLACIHRRTATVPWVIRALVIAAGAVIPALWFAHVFRSDPVFQARAATPTFSPNFVQVLFGYLPMLALGLNGLYVRAKQDVKNFRLRKAGLGLFGIILIALTGASTKYESGYLLSAPVWGLIFLLALVSVYLMSDEEPAWNLITSWAVLGVVAIYFPGLFQRKLSMGMSIPWAILTAFAVSSYLERRERSARNLATTLVILLLSSTSFRWLARETTYIRNNVASTTRHSVYLSPDVQQILAYLNKDHDKKVVLALPGAGLPLMDDHGQAVPDEFQAPALPDVAPIVTGFTGAYTYAGHWSETPNYGQRCAEMYRFFLSTPFQSVHTVMSSEDRKEFIHSTGANYAIFPVQETYTLFPLIKPETVGKVVVAGSQFQLVRLSDY